MKRIYSPFLREYLGRKIILLTGPRQSGKTTLARMLSSSFDYLNYDSEDDRKIYAERSWDRSKKVVIFDELHKMPGWKRWLKGIYDTEGLSPAIVVTGSARMDSYRKVGDSLAGRHFQYRLHPLDPYELHSLYPNGKIAKQMQRLLQVSGFPEPYLNNDSKFYNLWKRSHLDIILKQDLPGYEDVRNLASLELLVQLLRERVGSPLSYSSLAQDLRCSDKTIKRWLSILEDMYVVFPVQPYHKSIARAIHKQPKYYFYDSARVLDAGARLENMVATSLIKQCHFRQDCHGEEWGLHYLRKKDGIEIDFLLTRDDQPWTMIEAKQSDSKRSANFASFARGPLANIAKIQLAQNLQREHSYPDKLEIRELGPWLAKGLAA